MAHSEYKSYVLKVNGTDLTPYIADEGYQVEWYDLSYDAGRNARGTMQMNIVASKVKIIINTMTMSETNFAALMSVVRANTTYSVEYFDPYYNQMKTVQCYRGDRTSTMKQDLEDTGILMQPISISFIEL